MKQHHRESWISLIVLVVLAFVAPNAIAQNPVLDDFETGAIRVVQPAQSQPLYHNMWNLDSAGAGPVVVTNSDKHDGSFALKATQASGTNFQLEFYTYTEGLSGWGDGWHFMREFVNNPTMKATGAAPAWPLNTMNRLRFWIKLPTGYNSATPDHNFEFGTFIRRVSADRSEAESDNMHYYHFLDLRSTGQWEQVIIDTHPDHQRGNDGNTEVADSPQTAQAGYNYFDMMTRFYIDIPYDAVPGDVYLDGFEFYNEPNPENTAQVRAIHGVYIPSTHAIEVGWTRPKNEDSVSHEVRYAFSSIHTLGWANATVPSGGTVTPKGSGGFNGMKWTSTAVDVTGHDTVYIAIKPQNSSSFREIAIPTTTTVAVKPQPPTSLLAH